MTTYLNIDAIEEYSVPLSKLEETPGGLKASIYPMIEITYTALKELRDNEELIPGQQYRIIDYITTTTQTDTSSANHQFDIIVTADSKNTLNEKARVCLHEGDTYFVDSDLNAWQIWYCLDNDINRFYWADENGKGVIYRMIDEWGNDCPYDFKNIIFLSKEIPGDGTSLDMYTFTWVDEEYNTIDSSVFGNNGSLTCYSEIYGVRNNVIKPYMEMIYDEDSGDNLGTKQLLNNITFISDAFYEGIGNDGFYGCNNNSFENNCYNNSFGNNCYNNSFGNYCYNSSFGNGCYYSSFGNYCYGNSFGNGCYYNSFGNGCQNNSFGNFCYNNVFGKNCRNNSFRTTPNENGNLLNYCLRNTFDDGCNKIVIYSTSTTGNNSRLENVKVDKSASSINSDYVYYEISTINSLRPILISNEYNAVALSSDIPIGLYNTNTAVNNKVYTTNVTVTPSRSCVNAAGGFYETSDERLKIFLDDVTIDLEKLSSLRKKYFTWKDGHGDQQLGVSAQEVQVLYPELVNEGDDGNLSVDYAKLSVVALSAVDKLYNKQKDLEDKLAKIEKALNL